MNGENVRIGAGDLVRWLLLAAILLAAIGAYFVLSPRVAPAVQPQLESGQ